MTIARDSMGLGLRVLNRLAGWRLVDRLRLRKATEQAIYHGSRAGFGSVLAAGRAFKATQKLLAPARLAQGPRHDLFDLTPSEEQQMLREACRSFAIEQLRPAAAGADKDCAAPADLLRQSVQLGLTSMGIPEALGGAGSERSTLSNVLVAEALAEGDLSLALACLAPCAVSTALVLWGDAGQQALYLPAFVAEEAPPAALALMEPRTLFDPYRLETRARREEEAYVLSGVKSLTPRAGECALFIVAAHLEGRGPALFLIEAGTPGLRLEAEPAMGLRAAGTARLHLDHVRLPMTALLGDGAEAVYADCVNLARLAWCALAVGASKAVLDHVIPYVNERSAFGEPISHRQAVAFAVADMAVELEGMRLATYRAASRAEQGLGFARETALARRLCADQSMRIGSNGVQLLGGHGYTREYPVERWYRDLRAVALMEGAVLV